MSCCERWPKDDVHRGGLHSASGGILLRGFIRYNQARPASSIISYVNASFKCLYARLNLHARVAFSGDVNDVSDPIRVPE